MTDLKTFFYPKSIAVIGASHDPNSVGHAIFRNLRRGGFRGPIWPVNIKGGRILGVKVYPSVLDIPKPVDLAILIVPAAVVPGVLRECATKRVPSGVIVSAGFKEVGGRGVQLEEEIQEIARKNSMRLIGPNCLGLINPDPKVKLNASFACDIPLEGNIAFLSQSGALCTAILDHAKGEHIGFSRFVSIGNKADISEIDLLRYLMTDRKTRVVLLYIEDIVDGHAFIDVCRTITGEIKDRKPVLAIKSGRTQEGAKAVSSHTGSLAGSDEVYAAILRQAGVLRVDSVGEMFDYATAFSYQPLPKGRRVAIITNAGGPGIMATDACVRSGLELAQLSSETQELLRQKLPAAANVHNPVDVIGDGRSDRYDWALKNVLKDDCVDGAIVLLTPQAMTDIEEIARVVVRHSKKTKKPILASFMGQVEVAKGVKILIENHIPHYRFPEAAARSMAAMVRYTEWLERPRTEVIQRRVNTAEARRILDEAKKKKLRFLSEVDATQLLASYGLPVLKTVLAKTEAECQRAANQMGFPVALKISSPDLVHKTDVQGVVLNLANEDEVLRSFRDMTGRIRSAYPQAKIWGVTVQQMAGRGGLETILGMKRDPKFGPLLMFGLGGIYVEMMRDVTFRLAPVRHLSAVRMIEGIKGYALLKGFRNQPARDVEAIQECLERLSQLAVDCEEIEELDVNPLFVYEKGKGCRVIDARVAIK